MSQFFASAGWEEATELRVRDRHAQHVSGLGSGGSLGLECHPPHGPPTLCLSSCSSLRVLLISQDAH